MAFDGIAIANIVKELEGTILGGKISKIAQPEKDELMLTIKNNGSQYRLMISADATLPLIYLTDTNKLSPMTAPNFCMLLRKHVQNARITNVFQPSLERIIHIELEHLDELGDLCKKVLVVEIMGKHSNIIFCNSEKIVIDSIKHISGMVSSVREVLPGRSYFIPETTDKKNPLEVTEREFREAVYKKELPSFKAIYTSFTGISPIIAKEMCYLGKVNEDQLANTLIELEKTNLFQGFQQIMEKVKIGKFTPHIIYDKGEPIEFGTFPLMIYANKQTKEYDSISQVLVSYYAEKNAITRIRQRSVDIRRIVQTALERNIKKYNLQMKQMQDTEKKDIYKVYGELINTYGYNVTDGAKKMEALNYYTDEMITIPLDPLLTPGENAKKYFDKYGKLKRTFEALSTLTKEVKEEIDHLESISTALDIALKEEDLVQIKEELIESGYIRRKGGTKRERITSKPFHYISSEGFDIYIGKNNFQNDDLTFKFAVGNDWWLHTKGIPGSHVIIKSNGKEVPNKTFEEAGRLAAHYSKAKGQEKVEIDYTQKKNVKKPSGGKPGFVVYYTNYSLVIDSDIVGINEVKS